MSAIWADLADLNGCWEWPRNQFTRMIEYGFELGTEYLLVEQKRATKCSKESFNNRYWLLHEDEELQPLIRQVGYEDKARKMDVKTLMQ